MAPPIGFKHSEEAKRKIGLAAIGNKFSLGKKLSEEHKQKISKANEGANNYWYGKKLSEGHIKNISLSHKGQHSSPGTEFKKGNKHTKQFKKMIGKVMKENWALGKMMVPSGNKHGLWKGNKVGYRALHGWINRQLGKADHCEECKLDKIPEGKKRWFQWANISHKYKRKLNDWKQLCYICHKSFDGYGNRKVNS